MTRRVTIAVVIALAQSPASWAQSAGAKSEFDVASVRALPQPGTLIQTKPGKLLEDISGNRFTKRVATVASLILDAYNVRADQVTGLPGWASDSNRYEIRAVAGGERTTPEQVRPMLQTLLADRFQLRLHHETKKLTVYELTIGKSGPKLKLFPDRTPEHRNVWSMVPTLIEFNLDYPIVDKTGLGGFFDTNYELKWNKAELQEEMREARPSALPPGAAFHGLAPSIFQEVEAEFGLRLQKVTAPSDVIVVDHVERPSEN